MASKMRWGDTAEDDDGADYAPGRARLDTAAPAPVKAEPAALPPQQVYGPDKHGIKTVIDWKINSDGLRVKTTKKIRMVRKLKRVSKAVQRRRQWKPFGDARDKAENETLTMVSTEEIYLERVRMPSSKAEPEKSGDPLAALAGKNTSLLVCRICGKKGDHWTSKCPYKDLAATKNMIIGEKPPGEDDGPGMAGGKAGGYVPPSMRAGGGDKMGESMRRRGDDNSIRVTNLSEDTREADLQELFRPFGPVTRIYVAFDRETGESRGFAFINFVNRDDAQRAIDKLNGYGYDNLILRVEWSAPRPERPGGNN